MADSVERMISPERALELVLARVPPPRVEVCDLSQALGRTLAEDLAAVEDIPPFDRAMMDGFCVRLADRGGPIEVLGEVAAGQLATHTVEPGRGLEIMTGAPCPAGTEAIVPVEQVTRGEGVLLPEEIALGQHVQRRGEICPAGTRTLSAGARVTPLALANLAAFGRSEVALFARPSVAVITTGDELLLPGQPARAGAIHDSNGPMLAALALLAGASRVSRLHARDNERSLVEALEEASGAEIVVLSGGVSMGRYDLVPTVVGAAGFDAVFHKVTQKPGKPLLFAAAPQRLLFGLPGNTRSSHFCFTRYVSNAIGCWAGREVPAPWQAGRLTRRLVIDSKRTLFLPIRARGDGAGGFELHPFDEKGSADIFNVARANAYAHFEPGSYELPPGATLPFAPFAPTWE